MKLPIPFLLYTAALGLVGFTGWQVYELLPLQKAAAKNAAHERGRDEAMSKLSVGRSQGPVSADWYYTGVVSGARRTGNRWWWQQFKETNFIGKPPPPPPTGPTAETDKPPEVVRPERTPLENIFELVALICDSRDDGAGEYSHILIRYKPDSGVTPPEWYVEQQGASASGFGGPGDGVPPPRPGGNQKFQGGANNRGRGASAPASPMPVAQGTGKLEQKLWVNSADEKMQPQLWHPFEHIRLVRVAPDAQSAYFVRKEPPEGGGEPVDLEPEQLFYTVSGISQELARTLAELSGEEMPDRPVRPPTESGRSTVWRDSEETTVADNTWNIGRKDHQRFQSEDELFEKVYFDSYSSKVSSTRGLIVRNVDPQLASKFGVSQGDVLLSVNGRAVKTQAEAVQFGKGEYKKGVRSFVTKWLSAGAEVERVYNLPDK